MIASIVAGIGISRSVRNGNVGLMRWPLGIRGFKLKAEC